MADFTSLQLEGNINGTATQNWHPLIGAGKELRLLDVNTGGQTTASASWSFVTRPASGTIAVDYYWVYDSDAIGGGIYGGSTSAVGTAGAAPAAYATTQYLQMRWNWDATGTFASAPIFTAYATTAHAAITRGDGSILGGHASDTGATARSYLKGLAYGSGATMQVPAAGPGSAPVVTDGATGAVTAGAAAWSAVQGLQGDNDYILYNNTPTALTAQVWYVQFRAFIGLNLTPGTLVPVLSLKYTYT
jgi:hypothetical protein